MISNKLRRFLIIFLLFALTFFSLVLMRPLYVDASGATTFSMINGSSVCLYQEGGMRFKVKMDETTALELKSNTTTKELFFIIGPRSNFDAVIKTGGEYHDLVSNPNKVYALKVDVAKNTIYEENGYYYANGCIWDIKEDHRNTEYTGIACIKDGNNITYATNNIEDVTRSEYSVLVSALLDIKQDYIDKISSVYNWLGTVNNPIKIDKQDSFNNLVRKLAQRYDKYNALNYQINNNIKTGDEMPSFYTKYCGGMYAHDLEEIEGKTPTSISEGWAMYYKCKKCDYNTKRELPICNAITDTAFRTESSYSGMAVIERYDDDKLTGIRISGYHFYSTNTSENYMPKAIMNPDSLSNLKSYMTENDIYGIRLKILCLPSGRGENAGLFVDFGDKSEFIGENKWKTTSEISKDKISTLQIRSVDESKTNIFFQIEFVDSNTNLCNRTIEESIVSETTFHKAKIVNTIGKQTVDGVTRNVISTKLSAVSGDNTNTPHMTLSVNGMNILKKYMEDNGYTQLTVNYSASGFGMGNKYLFCRNYNGFTYQDTWKNSVNVNNSWKSTTYTLENWDNVAFGGFHIEPGDYLSNLSNFKMEYYFTFEGIDDEPEKYETIEERIVSETTFYKATILNTVGKQTVDGVTRNVISTKLSAVSGDNTNTPHMTLSVNGMNILKKYMEDNGYTQMAVNYSASGFGTGDKYLFCRNYNGSTYQNPSWLQGVNNLWRTTTYTLENWDNVAFGGFHIEPGDYLSNLSNFKMEYYFTFESVDDKLEKSDTIDSFTYDYNEYTVNGVNREMCKVDLHSTTNVDGFKLTKEYQDILLKKLDKDSIVRIHFYSTTTAFVNDKEYKNANVWNVQDAPNLDFTLGVYNNGQSGFSATVYFIVEITSDPIAISLEPKEEDTSEYIFKDGYSDYKLLVSNSLFTLYDSSAIAHLRELFYNVSGCELDIVFDDAVNYTSNQKYISLGNTKLFTEKNPTPLPTSYSGYKIITDNEKNIYIVGKNDASVCFGVLGLFEDLFNLEYYAKDCYTIDTLNELEYQSINIEKEFSFDIRIIGFAPTWFKDVYTKTIYTDMKSEDYMNNYGHSFSTYLPPTTYYSAHPEWFSNYKTGATTDWQFCLYDNNGLRSDLVNELAKKVVASIKANPNLKIFSLGHNDGDGHCTCDNCRNHATYYSDGSSLTEPTYRKMSGVTASYIEFYSAVINSIRTKLADENRYNELKFLMFAYTVTQVAPTGTNQPSLPSNLNIIFAPIATNFKYSFNDTKQNQDTTTMYNTWNTYLTSQCGVNYEDRVFLWYYSSNFDYNMMPYDFTSKLDDNLALFNNKAYTVFFQGVGTEMPNFSALNAYVAKKVTTDFATYGNDAKINELITDFCNAYYGAGGSFVKMYYDAIRNKIQNTSNINSYCVNTGSYNNGFTTTNWTASNLTSYANYFINAKNAILGDRTYEQLSVIEKQQYDRVEYEMLDVYYIALELHMRSTFSQYSSWLSSFKTIAEKNGFTYCESKYSSWDEKANKLL